MTEFLAQLQERVTTTSRELRAAEEAGDLYTAGIMSASLAELQRIAREHELGVLVPGEDPPVARTG